MAANVSPQQAVAQQLARHLGALEHVFVVSEPAATRLRIECFACCKHELLGELQAIGVTPRFINLTFRIDATPTGRRAAEVYEVDTTSVKKLKNFAR